MTLAMLAAGLVLLVLGGELLVRGAVRSAAALGVSPLLIGLTLVGFGASTPELVTSVQAALVGSPGVAVGNVVGSNICNILLILGLAALIRPVVAEPRGFRRDGPVLAAATVIGLGVVLWGEIGRLAGVVLVGLLVAYVVGAYLSERSAAREGDPLPVAPRGLAVGLPMALAGLALVVVGADWLVDGAITLARGWGVSETLIGLTIVAVGTSLPELTASVIAAIRGQSDVAFGNIVGSNIYNILGILGVTALVKPLEVPQAIVAFDGWVMLAATAAMIAFAYSGALVTRREGGAMLAGYATYLGWLIATA
jgi:cation:H+ antiporter